MPYYLTLEDIRLARDPDHLLTLFGKLGYRVETTLVPLDLAELDFPPGRRYPAPLPASGLRPLASPAIRVGCGPYGQSAPSGARLAPARRRLSLCRRQTLKVFVSQECFSIFLL